MEGSLRRSTAAMSSSTRLTRNDDEAEVAAAEVGPIDDVEPASLTCSDDEAAVAGVMIAGATEGSEPTTSSTAKLTRVDDETPPWLASTDDVALTLLLATVEAAGVGRGEDTEVRTGEAFEERCMAASTAAAAPEDVVVALTRNDDESEVAASAAAVDSSLLGICAICTSINTHLTYAHNTCHIITA